MRIREGQGGGWGGGLWGMKWMPGVRVRLQRAGMEGWSFTLGRQEGG